MSSLSAGDGVKAKTAATFALGVKAISMLQCRLRAFKMYTKIIVLLQVPIPNRYRVLTSFLLYFHMSCLSRWMVHMKVSIRVSMKWKRYALAL